MIQEIVLEISLLVFMASFISSPRLRNAQSYKLLGFLGDFAFTWPHHLYSNILDAKQDFVH